MVVLRHADPLGHTMNRKKIFEKILKKIKTGEIDSLKSFDTEEAKLDLSGANIKYDIINDGQTIMIHNVPIAKEIVQPYYDALGNIEYHYKPKDSIQGIKSTYSPVSISHPTMHFSDMTKDMQEELTIGYMINGYYEEDSAKHYTDLMLWMDKVPQWLKDRIEQNIANDVSIGFVHDKVKEPGTFEGKSYDFVQKNIKIDHLAILQPTERGRASFSDGVGVGADSNDSKNNGGHTMADGFEQKYMDSVEDATKLRSDLKVSQDSLKAKDEQIKALEDKYKDFDSIVEKAKKFDKAEEEAVAEEEKKTEDLKAKILKIKDTEDTKTFIEGMDSDKLGLYLKQISGNSNGLPATGASDTGIEQPGFKALRDKIASQNAKK